VGNQKSNILTCASHVRLHSFNKSKSNRLNTNRILLNYVIILFKKRTNPTPKYEKHLIWMQLIYQIIRHAEAFNPIQIGEQITV
jgi:predicted secreted Zn-dependent protease